MNKKKISNKKSGKLLIVVLLLGLLVTLHLSWIPLNVSIGKYVTDDAFVGYTLAKNYVQGNGVTFDGTTKIANHTPLWTFILSLIYFFTHEKPYLLVHISLILLSVFHILTGLILYKILRRYLPTTISLLSTAFWVLNYHVIEIVLTGLETALSILLISLFIYYYLNVREKLDIKNLLKLGFLLSLILSNRLDGIFLIFVIALDITIMNKKRITEAFSKVSLIGILPFLTLTSIIIFNYINAKVLFPTAGKAWHFWFNYGIKGGGAFALSFKQSLYCS